MDQKLCCMSVILWLFSTVKMSCSLLCKKPEECVFPFQYRGQTYKNCTTVDDPWGEYWCSHHAVHPKEPPYSWSYCNCGGGTPQVKDPSTCFSSVILAVLISVLVMVPIFAVVITILLFYWRKPRKPESNPPIPQPGDAKPNPPIPQPGDAKPNPPIPQPGDVNEPLMHSEPEIISESPNCISDNEESKSRNGANVSDNLQSPDIHSNDKSHDSDDNKSKGCNDGKVSDTFKTPEENYDDMTNDTNDKKEVNETPQNNERNPKRAEATKSKENDKPIMKGEKAASMETKKHAANNEGTKSNKNEEPVMEVKKDDNKPEKD